MISLSNAYKAHILGVVLVLCSAISGCNTKVDTQRTKRAVAVETALITQGEIFLKRSFSGTLEATAKFIVSPKVTGRIVTIHCDLGDAVKRGQVVVDLDDDEYRQQVAQAEADLAVAKANRVEAQNALEIAGRELDRVLTLRERGIASDTRLDSVRATHQAAFAQSEVAAAQVMRAKAAVRSARIRLSYTRITANWTEGDDQRVVAERYVDEGETVSANTALLSIVELDPIIAVIYVPERDYARLRVGQSVSLTTDAYPGERFAAQIGRIAPVFKPGSRQARVELTVNNIEQRLKPGLFVLTTIQLDRAENATIVPSSALTTRGATTGVFLVDPGSQRVAWREVKVGIRENERVQVFAKGLKGRVVTLGHQLLEDGSAISLPNGRGEK